MQMHLSIHTHLEVMMPDQRDELYDMHGMIIQNGIERDRTRRDEAQAHYEIRAYRLLKHAMQCIAGSVQISISTLGSKQWKKCEGRASKQLRR